jgi:hypothetical protein
MMKHQDAPVRPESEVLLNCARVNPGTKAAARVRELCKQPLDWTLLYEGAELHGLIPLLYLNLKQICPDAVPPNILNMLKVRFIEHSRRSLIMLDELKNILGQLKEKGVAAVPFKGPLLAERYYGDLVLRSFCDLDLWVPELNVIEAQECLERLTYTPFHWRDDKQFDDAFFKSELFRRLCSEYAYVKRSDRTCVDLHWKVLPPEFFPVSDNELIKHTRTIEFARETIESFTDEVTLVVTCIHGCKHAWSQLSWITDVFQIVEKSAIDWKYVFDFADKIGARKMVLSGLYLANTLMGSELPEPVLANIKEGKVSLSCEEIINKFLKDPIAPDWKELKKWIYFVGLKDTKAEQYSFLLHMCTAPTLDEAMRFILPLNLYPIYFAVRPINLAVAHAPRILMRLLKGGYDRHLNVKEQTEG